MLFPMWPEEPRVMLATIFHMLGPFPAKWQHSITRIEDPPSILDFFDAIPRGRPLASLVHESCPDLLPSQQETFLELLQGMLAYEPTQRLSAKDITGNPWFSE